MLGEGPLWHPEREQLFWFDIPSGVLFGYGGSRHADLRWEFGEPASAAGWIDQRSLIVATASGLQKLDVETDEREPLVQIEAGNPVTRSNDGRTGPDGSFWIGTMGRKHESGAGAYYRYQDGTLSTLFGGVTIPNATCFTPDGRTAYLADTRQQVIWRWTLDQSGSPQGERTVHIDLRHEEMNPDGAVCDAEGYLWVALYGSSRLARYTPDGSEDRVIELPISQPTCPAFGGANLTTIYITSARQNLTEDELSRQPDAGRVIVVETDVSGFPEYRVAL